MRRRELTIFGAMRRMVSLLIGLVLVSAGCSSESGGDPAASSGAPESTAGAVSDTSAPSATDSSATEPTEETAAPSDTLTDEEMAAELEAMDSFSEALDDDGTLSFETALSLFASTLRPLPGVEPADFEVTEIEPVVRRIVLDEALLTEEQAAVVDSFLGGPGTPLDEIPDGGGGGASARFPRIGTVAEAAPIVREAKALFDRELGMSVPESFFVLVDLPMVEPDGSRNFSGPLNAASATGEFEGGEVAQRCRIRLNRDAASGGGMFRSQVAHEVFHCYQYQVHGRNNWPLWAAEGGAGWVGEDFAGGSGMSATWWARWINQPTMPLVLRSYDAIGLFSLADRLGVNTHQLAMDLTGSPFMSTLTAATGEEIFDLWGAHYGDPAWGADWSVIGPGAPSTRAPAAAFTPILDGGASFVTDARTDRGTAAQPVEFTAPGDVLRMVGFAGIHGRLRFGDGSEAALVDAADFCLRSGGCECPEGSTGGAPTVQVGSNQVFVGLGPSSASGPQFAAMSLEAFCAAPAPTDTALPPEDGYDSCLVGRWVSTRLIAPIDPGVNETSSGGGGIVQVFGADGTFSIDFSAMTPIESVVDAPEDQRFKTTLTYSGSGSGTWSSSGGVITAGGLDMGAFRIDYRSEIIGIAVVVEDGFALNDPRLTELGGAGAAPVGSGRYTCSGGTLVITNSVPGYGDVGFEFGRG